MPYHTTVPKAPAALTAILEWLVSSSAIPLLCPQAFAPWTGSQLTNLSKHPACTGSVCSLAWSLRLHRAAQHVLIILYMAGASA